MVTARVQSRIRDGRLEMLVLKGDEPAHDENEPGTWPVVIELAELERRWQARPGPSEIKADPRGEFED